MKRILLALLTIGFLLPLTPRAHADTEVSLDFFYDNLADQGSWIEVGDYGYCFQPNVAVDDPSWRPYADGYWAYTDAGWTWVSYEDFGWATYHYGRWTNLADYGWVWVPGYEWGPAWVSWRTGGDYVGWAPLPPQGNEVVYEGSAITGAVDITFGIGPLYYNFVDIRYIGEPVLRARLIEPSRNVTIIHNTVNVTNITYNNSIVVNNGPDLNRVNRFSARPIQHLTLQRDSNVPAAVGQGGHRGNFNRVNGQQFVVVTPRVQKPTQPVAPRQVKAKVAAPKIERGWQGVANRQQIEAGMKKENPRNVSAPSFQPQRDRGGRSAPAAAQNGPGPNDSRSAGPNGPAAGNNGGADRAIRPLPRENRNPSAGPGMSTNPATGAEQAQQAQPPGMNGVPAEQERNQQGRPARNLQAEQRQQARQAVQAQQAERARRAAQAQEGDRISPAAHPQESEPPNNAAAQQSGRMNGLAHARRNSQQAPERPRPNQPQESERPNDAAQAQQSGRMNGPAHAGQSSQQAAERPRPNPAPPRPVQQAPRERGPYQQQIQRSPHASPQQSEGGNQTPDGERKNKKKKPGEDPPPQG
jgi:hypothetical protein